MKLETRSCVCQKSFKVLPTSKQKFCSQYCDPHSATNMPGDRAGHGRGARKKERPGEDSGRSMQAADSGRSKPRPLSL